MYNVHLVGLYVFAPSVCSCSLAVTFYSSLLAFVACVGLLVLSTGLSTVRQPTYTCEMVCLPTSFAGLSHVEQ